jgi:carbon storage regulator
MLVLSRKLGEKITIGDGIVVSVMKINGNRVQLGVEAPAHIRIQREELESRLAASGYLSASSVECMG